MIDTFEAVDIMTGLAACQKYIPNLILLQLRLNTWDGFEVIRRLKDDPRTRSIPVIFLANSALTAEKAKGIDMGAVDFVSQPYDSVELLARVHSALRTKALLDLLEQRAHLDGLTELGNRFALTQMIPQEIHSCRDAGVPLSILIADLDHFKKVNDHYGHSAGDEVLRRFAVILRHATRETDFLARYGGEEFVVLCPNCDTATALDTAERIRAGVSGHTVQFRNSTINMTTSVGVLSTSKLDLDDPQLLLDRADQALYRAKSGGRNVVWMWDEGRGAPILSPTAAKPTAASEGGLAAHSKGNATPSEPSTGRTAKEPRSDEAAVILPVVERRASASQSPPPAGRSMVDEEAAARRTDGALAAQGSQGPRLGIARQKGAPSPAEASVQERRPLTSQSPRPIDQGALGSTDEGRPVLPPKPRTFEADDSPSNRNERGIRIAGNSSGEAARLASSSSSEIEALWGVSRPTNLVDTPASSTEGLPQRSASSLFVPRPSFTPAPKPPIPPKRAPNAPPPPPPNPRLSGEFTAGKSNK